MINREEIDTFLPLVRYGVGHEVQAVAETIDWSRMIALAEQQGLSAVVLDGAQILTDRGELDGYRAIDYLQKVQWIGEVLQNFEGRYEAYKQAISNLAGFYNSHGFKMMVLKGCACSIDWRRPEHRPCGDIDIWLFGRYKEADALMEKEKGIKVDRSHHHHTIFEWHGFTVENHYDFINVHSRKPNVELEKIFKELGKNDSHFVEIGDGKVYLPSPNLHALFLMRHLVSHFTSVSVTLRQVLDWSFFVEKHTKEVDWEWLEDVLDEYHMKEFFNLINAICVGDLGFDASIFPNVQFNPALKDKVLKDILYPKYSASEPSCLIPRLLYKYRRWQGNAWKQELCYSESRWSAFWSGVWGHLLKPNSL